jgi:hypothetical protein
MGICPFLIVSENQPIVPLTPRYCSGKVLIPNVGHAFSVDLVFFDSQTISSMKAGLPRGPLERLVMGSMVLSVIFSSGLFGEWGWPFSIGSCNQPPA